MSFEVDALAKVVERRAPSPAALDRLGTAVALVDELRGQGDLLLDRFVGQARGEGCSWTQIGETLGISKQAAHQRFLPAEQAAGSWPPHATDLVRRALATGQQEAQAIGHNCLGTEHALLGLLAERDGLAAHALAALGVDDAGVRARIELRVGTGPARPWAPLGVAPRLKRALEIARSYARSLDHRCLNTEHLLLALVDVSDSVAAEILRDLNATPYAVRQQVADMLGVDADRLRPRRQRRRLRRA
jgi:Clp amino terminal domain, pathogenicity island component